MRVIEVASIAILALFLAGMVRFGLRAAPRPGAPAALADILRIAAAAWVAEVSCIRLYGFYQYDAPWLLFLDVMPVLVALIWPFVILSAREVVHALGWVDGRGRPHPLAVMAVVIYDAALVEPIAVRTGLWSWNEPGLWSVPLIGIIGWGLFAACASALLDTRRPSLLLLLAPLGTHALLLALWWGLFRWILRDELTPTAAVALSAAVAVVGAWWVRRSRRKAPLTTMVPRMAAAGLFFVLLFVAGGQDVDLVAYGLSFAIPYVMATRFRA